MRRYCESADITMQEFKQTFQYQNTDVLVVNIKYPVINMYYNPRVEIIINRQISMEVDDYLRYVRLLYNQAIREYEDAESNGYPFHPYQAYMEYVITYNENCFLSLYIDRYEYTGGAHGITNRKSKTWELCNGTLLPLYSFFNPGTDHKLFLTEEILRQAERNMQKNPNIYFEDYKMLIIKNFDFDSFYLTPKGITIYYQQYEIAPYSTGIVEFIIPYGILGWYPNC